LGILFVGAVVVGRLTATRQPDVVLMDIRMPVLDGLQATRQIVSDPALAQVRVLILTIFESDEYVFEALRSGASGFVVKDIRPADLLQAIRVVAAGEALLSRSVTRRLISDFVSRAPPPRQSPQLAALTVREVAVLKVIAAGLGNREIADQFVVSEATVKTHVGRVLAKLDARDRAQLVVFAYENGLVTPGRH
jgi:DNA-binding NarL/FixJ family response regulator